MTTTFAIYVASLSDYNNGFHHGQWINIDSTTTKDDVNAVIFDKILATSPSTKKYGELAEEWAVHDYENFPSQLIGSYGGCDINTLIAYATAVEEHGAAIEAYMSYYGDSVKESVEQFEDRYAGVYEDEEDYAYELVESTGMLHGVAESIKTYFDYESFARDLFLDGVTGVRHEGSFYVFNDC